MFLLKLSLVGVIFLAISAQLQKPNGQCNRPGERFLTCGSACPATCDNPNINGRHCTLRCVKGCFCRKGLVRELRTGQCVLPLHCSLTRGITKAGTKRDFYKPQKRRF